MKTHRMVQSLFVSLWLVVIAGCVTTPAQRAERLVTPLPKLTAAVDAFTKAIEAHDHSTRLSAIEEQLKPKKGK